MSVPARTVAVAPARPELPGAPQAPGSDPGGAGPGAPPRTAPGIGSTAPPGPPLDPALRRAPGVYSLLLRVPRSAVVSVGRLGEITFARGWYLYTGSAMAGLGPRIARHLEREKPLRWHIDCLRQVAEPRWVHVIMTTDRIECECSRAALACPGAVIAAPGFGSSDCGCPSHLVRFADAGPVGRIRAALAEIVAAAPGRRGRTVWRRERVSPWAAERAAAEAAAEAAASDEDS